MTATSRFNAIRIRSHQVAHERVVVGAGRAQLLGLAHRGLGNGHLVSVNGSGTGG